MLNLEARAREPHVDRRLPAPKSDRPVMIVAAAAAAGVLVIVIARWWTATGYQPAPAGLPDAGPLTSIGLPVTQFIQRMAATAVVGLLFLRCLAPAARTPQSTDHLSAMTVRWAVVWAAGTGAGMMFTLSSVIGVPVTGLSGDLDTVLILLGSQQLLAQVVTLWVAVLVALFGRKTAAVGSAVLLAVSAAALLPGAVTGHAGHHGNPVAAMTILGVHVVAAAVWVGGLVALVLHLRGFSSDLRLVLPKFSTAALVCLLAVGVSGLLESALMLDGWTALVGSDRGRLIIGKTLAIASLATVGHCHRRFTMGPAAAGRLLPLLRLAAVETVVMTATVGLAVVLSLTG